MNPLESSLFMGVLLHVVSGLVVIRFDDPFEKDVLGDSFIRGVDPALGFQNLSFGKRYPA